LRAAGLYLDDEIVEAALKTVAENWGDQGPPEKRS